MAVVSAAEAPARPAELRPSYRALRRLVRSRPALVGGSVVLLFLVLALAAPALAPYDPLATDWGAVRKAPSARHWLGTDELGRDELARMIWGARASLAAGILSVAIALGIGLPIGLLSGYRSGVGDALLMRLTDAMLACPFLILAIALAA